MKRLITFSFLYSELVHGTYVLPSSAKYDFCSVKSMPGVAQMIFNLCHLESLNSLIPKTFEKVGEAINHLKLLTNKQIMQNHSIGLRKLCFSSDEKKMQKGQSSVLCLICTAASFEKARPTFLSKCS